MPAPRPIRTALWSSISGSSATARTATARWSSTPTAARALYPVTLTVRDNSGTDSSTDSDQLTVRGQRAAGRRGGRRPAGDLQRGRLRRHRRPATPTARSPATNGTSATAPAAPVPRRFTFTRSPASISCGSRSPMIPGRCAAAPATACGSRSTPRRSPMPAPIWSAPRSGAGLRRRGLARSRRRRRRVPVAVQGGRDRERTAGQLRLRPARGLPRPPRGARRHQPGHGGRLRRGQGGDQCAARGARRARHPRGAGRCGDLRCRRRVRSGWPDRHHRWDFSDQPEPTVGQQVVRAYTAPGVYTAQLTVTDDSGAINAVDQDELEIRINHAPVAEAGPDIVTGQSTITFDGSGSADADGDPLTYRWDFGDGSPAAAGARVAHTYAEGGIYPVVLTVDDGTGLSNASDRASLDADHQPAAGRRCRRQPGGLRRRRRGVRRQRVAATRTAVCCAISWDFGDGTSAGLVNPTKTYDPGRRLSGDPDRAGRVRLRQRQPHRPDRRPGRRVADLGGGAGSGGLRGHGGALRRLGLTRLRRGGQPVPVGLRRRRHRRRRQAGARLPAARQLPGGSDHRGRSGRPVQQHRRRTRCGCASWRRRWRGSAGPSSVAVGAPGHLRCQRVVGRHGPDRELAMGLRRRQRRRRTGGRAHLPGAGAPMSSG